MNKQIKDLLERVLVAVVSDAWEESKHPRGGNPKNKGQFSKAEGNVGEKTTLKGKSGLATATRINHENFIQALSEAKASVAPNERWKVSAHTADEYKHEKAKTYTMNGGTVAVTGSGDIISVCANPEKGAQGYKLLELAVRKGGKKLDSYDGNFEFYTRNGFEPVSWVKWDGDYAPDDWKSDFEPQDIVFFKHVGKGKVSPEYLGEKGLDNFKNRVEVSQDYGVAMENRDKEIGK